MSLTKLIQSAEALPPRPPQPPRSRRNGGFTLIEVLVVVAIIALLVSILLPSLAAARRQAKTVECASNLRSIGQAMIYYLQANGDTFPPSGASWEVLHRYVQKVSLKMTGATDADAQVPFYLCPADEVPHFTTEVPYTKPDGTVVNLKYYLGYGINTHAVYAVHPNLLPSNAPVVLRKSSSIKRPGEIVLFCDSGDDDLDGEGPWGLTEKNVLDNPAFNQFGHELHHGTGNNFAFVDNHVSLYKLHKNSPPQYGLPTFPWAWIPGYKLGGPYDNFVRDPPEP